MTFSLLSLSMGRNNAPHNTRMYTRVSIGLTHVLLLNVRQIYTKLGGQFCPKVSKQISLFPLLYIYHEQVVCSSIRVINLGGLLCVSVINITLYLNITYFSLCIFTYKEHLAKKCLRFNNNFNEEILQNKTQAWFQQVSETSRFGNVIAQPRCAPTQRTFYQPLRRRREA